MDLTAYELEVLKATKDELSGGRLLELAGIQVQDVQVHGEHPDSEIVVAFTHNGAEWTKSFKLYNQSYPGGGEFPDAGVVAALIATNVVD